MKQELPDFQAGLRKGRGTRGQIANIHCILVKARVPEKHLLHWLRWSLWLCGSLQTVEISSRAGTTRPPDLPPEKLVCNQEATVKTRHRQQTGSKLGKEYIKAVYCHPAYLTYMQSTSCEMLSWMKHKLMSRLLGEISIISDIQMTSPLWQKANTNWRASW